MSSSSSTTRTRGALSALASIGRMVRPDRPALAALCAHLPPLEGRAWPRRVEGAGAMATRSTSRRPAPASKPAPAARRKPPARKPAKGKAKGGIEQRHLDLIGLGFVALSIFLAFTVWLGWDGGRAGDAVVGGLKWLVGAVHYAAPLAAMAAGVLLVLRPVLPAVKPIRAGTICLFLSTTLGLAAGTFGFGTYLVREGHFDVD